MPGEPKRPWSLVACDWAVRTAALLVPAEQRAEWGREWRAELWHRWLFLLHAGMWNRREAWRLMKNCAGAFADAAWHFSSQDRVQVRVRECIRSPWTCLGAWAGALLIVVCASGGLPATRNLFDYRPDRAGEGLLFIWMHPSSGGGDRGVPADVVPAWALHSRLLSGVAGFSAKREALSAPGERTSRPLVVRTEPGLFAVLGVKPMMGSVPGQNGALLSFALWREHWRSGQVLGRIVQVGQKSYPIAGVLPPGFRFLSRQPAVFLVETGSRERSVMVVARAKRGISEQQLDRNLVRIAEGFCYYFFRSELRYQSLESAAWLPLRMFGISALASALLLFAVSRSRIGHWRAALGARNKQALIRRAMFFSAKTGLGLGCVFTAALEWTRSESALLFGSRDPAAGPFLLWLFILGSMAVLFWAFADQGARCRVCLRLLCFPVRVGCPGCLLLDWSGTELLCTEGHGVLHVPHLAASWEDESERWIALDESWKGLFAGKIN